MKSLHGKENNELLTVYAPAYDVPHVNMEKLSNLHALNKNMLNVTDEVLYSMIEYKENEKDTRVAPWYFKTQDGQKMALFRFVGVVKSVVDSSNECKLKITIAVSNQIMNRFMSLEEYGFANQTNLVEAESQENAERYTALNSNANTVRVLVKVKKQFLSYFIDFFFLLW